MAAGPDHWGLMFARVILPCNRCLYAGLRQSALHGYRLGHTFLRSCSFTEGMAGMTESPAGSLCMACVLGPARPRQLSVLQESHPVLAGCLLEIGLQRPLSIQTL